MDQLLGLPLPGSELQKVAARVLSQGNSDSKLHRQDVRTAAVILRTCDWLTPVSSISKLSLCLPYLCR